MSESVGLFSGLRSTTLHLASFEIPLGSLCFQALYDLPCLASLDSCTVPPCLTHTLCSSVPNIQVPRKHCAFPHTWPLLLLFFLADF